MCEAFRLHFQNLFLPRSMVFVINLADFPWLPSTEAAACIGDIAEGEIHVALKRASSCKSPELGLSH